MGDGAFAVALILTVFLLILSVFNMFAIDDRNQELKRQAVERGYALYCPLTGEWAWKGECDQ